MKTEIERENATKQIEELVRNEATDTLIDFMTERQVKQLAEDWLQGKEPVANDVRANWSRNRRGL